MAHLTTINADGGPQVSVIWIGLDGDDLVSGRDEIRGYLASAGRAPIRWDEFADLVVHETTNPEIAIVEYEALGTVTTTGATYRQCIIAVFRVRNGQIISYRDYLNPLALAEAR
jgi:ketosteroid isomerase-like protein